MNILPAEEQERYTTKSALDSEIHGMCPVNIYVNIIVIHERSSGDALKPVLSLHITKRRKRVTKRVASHIF